MEPAVTLRSTPSGRDDCDETPAAGGGTELRDPLPSTRNSAGSTSAPPELPFGLTRVPPDHEVGGGRAMALTVIPELS